MPDASIDATEGLLLLHEPPVAVDVTEVAVPGHIAEIEDNVPAVVGAALTVTDIVALTVPQLFVFV